ncbi:ATP-binding protein [Streptomyces sp. ATexAB-D23]|uniref:sensor histidine kinase n=1 Tax=unclassified Streptomyces TaxID=2593676 RepID=UPI00036C4F15|nr:ATP-binding protein [Streptomyces sp. ATexAB-D23]MYY05128.1 two-component sensor histidine kinase [Streptomyces sp. SID4913]
MELSADPTIERSRLIDSSVARYAEVLRESANPLVLRPDLWASCERQGRQILGECIATLHGTSVQVAAEAELTSMALGVQRSFEKVSPIDSVHAARVLFDVAVETMTEAAAQLPAEVALSRFLTAVRMLHKSIFARVSAAAIGYESVTLRDVGEASTARRHQLARDLHDHIGSSISLALRCLDLYTMEQANGVESTRDRLQDARQALRDVFSFTRTMVSGLRVNELHDGLKEEIDAYSAAASDRPAEVFSRIDGDESWLPEQTRQELFLVVREALRNAFAHARADRIDILVSVFPDAAHATITDDGVGLPHPRDGDGTGLTAMRQRVTALGGTLELISEPGRGTRVQLRIPLDSAGTACR